jgi:hypothetical protein
MAVEGARQMLYLLGKSYSAKVMTVTSYGIVPKTEYVTDVM